MAEKKANNGGVTPDEDLEDEEGEDEMIDMDDDDFEKAEAHRKKLEDQKDLGDGYGTEAPDDAEEKSSDDYRNDPIVIEGEKDEAKEAIELLKEENKDLKTDSEDMDKEDDFWAKEDEGGNALLERIYGENKPQDANILIEKKIDLPEEEPGKSFIDMIDNELKVKDSDEEAELNKRFQPYPDPMQDSNLMGPVLVRGVDKLPKKKTKEVEKDEMSSSNSDEYLDFKP